MVRDRLKQPLLNLALILLMAGLACNAPIGEASDNPTEAPATSAASEATSVAPATTAAPSASDTPGTVATTAAALRGAIVYESDMRSGWVDLSTDTGVLQQTPQGYSISVDSTAPWALWSFTTLVERDSFYAEISGNATACAGQGAYGLMFDYVSETSFTFFIVRCDGSYSLFQRQASSTASLLLTGPLPEGISSSGAPVRVGVRRNAGLLELYVNETRVGEKEVPVTQAGDLGPYVQTGGGVTTVVFTDLRVYEALP